MIIAYLNTPGTILERYKFNGGETQFVDTKIESTTVPDVEDINRDNGY
jgi:hypothetical protein